MIIEHERFVNGWEEYDFCLADATAASKAYEALRDEGIMVGIMNHTVTIPALGAQSPAVVRARLIIEALQ